MNALDKHFGKQKVSQCSLIKAELALGRGNKRAVIVHADGTVAVNCAHERYDERLEGVTVDDIDLQQYTRCKPGRKAGTPIIIKL